jgi:hypothetical protein
MPLFYFLPFDFQADQKAQARVLEFDRGDVILIAAMGVIALGLFVAFVAVPLITALLP